MRFLFRLTAAAACALPLLAARCGTDAELAGFSLPPATQTGANTFGFVLEDKVWRDYGLHCPGAGKCDTNQVRVQRLSSAYGSTYELQAELVTQSRGESFYLQLNNLRRPGTYTPSSPGYNSALPGLRVYFERQEGSAKPAYETRRGTPYRVIVTRLDTVDHVIAGTFDGTLRDVADTTRTLTMTDGRFDVRYRP